VAAVSVSKTPLKLVLKRQLSLIQLTWPTFVTHLKSGNWSEIFYFQRKLLWKVYNLLISPLGLFLVLLLRLIRPWLLIRISILVSERIGHLAANTELYLCERDAGINLPGRRHIDLWYHNWPVCNNQLALMWNRELHVGPRWILASVHKVNALIPGGEVHQIPENTQADIDVHHFMDKFPPHLNFLTKEEERGQANLRQLGIPEGAPFVCLAVRDNIYLKKMLPWKSWGYHNYRDCDIQNFILAAQKLTESGYYVIRMGVYVKEAIDVDHPMIIDYATNGTRTDFMDIYLAAKCTFCIVGNAGFEAITRIFHRPIVYVDYVPFGMINTNSARFISTTKKHFLRDKNRFMTFKEIFESGADTFWEAWKYEAMGIDLVDSSPEEIAAVVLEMKEKVEGTWENTYEDEKLQRQFWKIFPKNEYHGELCSRIGADFLLQHKEQLH
jgi:putative glycosyltransferase (TIGR04372 family)